MNLRISTTGISQKCIKLASTHLGKSLTFIFNQSLHQGIVLDINVIPTNFRPISKLSTLMQIFNSYINNLLTSDNQ